MVASTFGRIVARALPWLLLLYCGASLLHFVHNAEFIADYPNLPLWISRKAIYFSWFAIFAIGLCGYLLVPWPLRFHRARSDGDLCHAWARWAASLQQGATCGSYCRHERDNLDRGRDCTDGTCCRVLDRRRSPARTKAMRSKRVSRSSSLEAACHCGAIRLALPRRPRSVVDCNCSICRRYGALWAYYRVGDVTIKGRASLSSYIWGDRSIRHFRCRHCGCITHWTPTKSSKSTRMGVNARNLDPKFLKNVRTRHFDGAVSWKYV